MNTKSRLGHTCKDCDFYRPFMKKGKDQKQGACHRFPPVSGDFPLGIVTMNDNIVDEDHWCGEMRVNGVNEY